MLVTDITVITPPSKDQVELYLKSASHHEHAYRERS
jgi:hypothetical protein